VLATPGITTCVPAATAVPACETITHVIRWGETLTSIAREYRVSIDRLVTWNGIHNPNLIWVGRELVVSMLSAAPPMPIDQIMTHIVRRGDTLTLVARQHGVSVGDLVAWNGIRSPNLIWVGQELRVPILPAATAKHIDQFTTHVIRRGETLTSVARQHGVSVGDLVAWNGIWNPNLIWAGQKLVVSVPPAHTRTPAPTLVPTAISTPQPNLTVAPTPTSTPTPFLSPEPTAMSTPMPPPTSASTAMTTPTPTQIPTVVEPPSAEEIAYVRQAAAVGMDHTRKSEALISLMSDASRDPSLLTDGLWKLQIAVALGSLELDGKSLQNLRAPRRFQDVHQDLLDASRLTDRAASLIPATVERLRPSTIEEIIAAIHGGRDAMNRAGKKLQDLTANAP